MPTPAKHRGSILNAAVTLFRRQGYTATGIADIIELSHAPRGSLYHYFPGGKAAIGEAAVEEAGRRVAKTMTDLAQRSSSTAELVVEHARLMGQWMAKSRFRDGCPITTVLLEMAPRDPGVTKAGRTTYAARNALLKERLLADGFDSGQADRLAVLCTSALLGALIQARVEKSEGPLLAAAQELAALVTLARPSKVGSREPG